MWLSLNKIEKVLKCQAIYGRQKFYIEVNLKRSIQFSQ